MESGTTSPEHCHARKWTLIIPCAGPLQPGATTRPKYLLTLPTGDLLVRRAAATVPNDSISSIVVTVLKDAEDAYNASDAVRRAFGDNVQCLVLDKPTGGPAETVRETIARTGITGPIAVKDGDSFFSIGEMPTTSFMAVSDLRRQVTLSAPARKGYVRLNEQGMIDDVVEKSVASNFISVGLYGFSDAEIFITAFDRLFAALGHSRLFVSHVIGNAIGEGHVFLPCPTEELVDIVTLADWNAHRANYATIVCDVDGVVFRNQSAFFEPLWGSPVEPIRENIDHLLALQHCGAQVVFMTARPEAYRDVTISELEAQGLRVHALVMNCHHSTRFLVNDYAQSNQYPSAIAINVERNRPQLGNLLLADLPTRDRDI